MSSQVMPQVMEMLKGNENTYQLSRKAQETQILHIHGKKDELFPLAKAKESLKRDIRERLQWKSFQMVELEGVRHKAKQINYEFAKEYI